MKQITTNQTSSPTSIAINSIENYFRKKLPPNFINFIKYNNGGIPLKKVFHSSGGDRVLERFLSIIDEPSVDLEYGIYDIGVVETQIGERLANDPNQVGGKLIPFGLVFSGDFLCFDYRNNPDTPEISLWLHEQSDEFSPVTEHVASSFEDFLELLRN